MTAMAQFDLTMDAADKDVLSRAAALMEPRRLHLCAAPPKKRPGSS